jgi:hypothetical protein
MPSLINLEDYIGALAAAIGEAWPECVPNGVYLPGEIGFADFDQKATDGEVPFAAISSSLQPERSGAYGITNYTWVDQVILTYIQRRDWRNRNMAATQTAMLDWLVNNDLTVGQRIGTPYPVYDLSVPVNMLFVQTGRPFWGFGVSFGTVVSMSSQ